MQKTLLLRDIVKRSLLPAFQVCGLLRAVSRLRWQGRAVVLNYHNVEPPVFRAHLRLLKRHYRVVSLDSLLSDRAPYQERTVALTFDDGYASFANQIAPLLGAAGLPATWFVSTSLIGTSRFFWFDRLRQSLLESKQGHLAFKDRSWRLHRWNRAFVAIELVSMLKATRLSERSDALESLIEFLGEPSAHQLARYQLATVDQMGSLHALIGVGSHSHTHARLSQLSEDELSAELTTSKALLQDWTGRQVAHFAFPSSDYDARVIRGVRDAGYASAWTTETRLITSRSDHYRMPRVLMDDAASTAVLSARLSPAVHDLGIVDVRSFRPRTGGAPIRGRERRLGISVQP